MIAKWTQHLWSIVLNLACQICFLKCTLVGCMYVTQRRWVSLVSSVKDNMKLFSKWQIAGAAHAKDLYEKMIFPSTADFRAIVSAGGIPGCEVTPEDVKTAKVIWGRSVLKMKGNTVRRNVKRLVQSVIKVPSELIKLQQDVELAIDIHQQARILHHL